MDWMESYAITGSEAKRIDVELTKRLRVMMKGKACLKENGHHKALSNAAVMTHWRIAPAVLELRLRRLRWLQDMVRRPEAHARVTAAIWGRLQVEQHDTIDAGGRPTTRANAYAKLLDEDMEALCDTTVAE